MAGWRRVKVERLRSLWIYLLPTFIHGERIEIRWGKNASCVGSTKDTCHTHELEARGVSRLEPAGTDHFPKNYSFLTVFISHQVSYNSLPTNSFFKIYR
jgi:hypothetical protein